MARDFPHLADSSFPDLDGVNVYKYANDFDYTRYDAAQMSLQLCSVPWDVGEVRVGQSIIPGLGNVVYFDTKAKRDKWFSDIPANECYRFETRFKELHTENEIDIPVPFDVACQYNYLVVKYSLFANDDSPVMYETNTGLREWFYFIREVEFLSPNTTKLHLILDAWQTFIYDLNIVNMTLERGHAPMVTVDAATYLTNPIGYCSDLLAPDIVNENASYWGNNAGSLIFNGGTATTQYAVIVTTADPRATWGTKAAGTWLTPAIAPSNLQDGSPAPYAFAVLASNLSGLLTNLATNIPQFLQTVQAVFFISTSLIDVGTAFTFGGQSCYPVTAGYKSSDVLTLTKSAFNFDSSYADIAKLYTYPYSYIEVSDGLGNDIELRIEDTNGKLSFVSRLNLVMPYIKIAGHVNSTGKGQSSSISFRNVNAQSMDIKGNWYKLLMEWDIPTFAIIQNAADHNDYATHYDRAQAYNELQTNYSNAIDNADNAKTNAYLSAENAEANAKASALTNKNNAYASADTAYDNAVKSAETAKANAYAGADNANANTKSSNATSKANADRSADTTYDNSILSATNALANANASANAAYDNAGDSAYASRHNANDSADLATANATLQTTANTAVTTANNTYIDDNVSTQNVQTWAKGQVANAQINGSTNNQIAADEQRAAMAASSAAISGAASAITSAVTGNIPGAIGAIVGAGTSAANAMADFSISANLASAQASLQTSVNNSSVTLSQGVNTNLATHQKTNSNSATSAQNTLTTSAAANASATAKNNATRSYRCVTGGSDPNTGTTYYGTRLRDKETANANATRDYETIAGHGSPSDSDYDKGNALRTKETAKANALASKNTADTIADNVKTTDKANALRDYETITGHGSPGDSDYDKGNALRTKETAKANADRTKANADTVATYNADTAEDIADNNYSNATDIASRDRMTAQNAIANSVKQAALESPYTFGSTESAGYANTKPLGLFANIVTQDDYSIAYAGDEFLRHGYNYSRQWSFDGNWNKCKWFTYWKLKDIWTRNINIPDMYIDRIRFLLLGGVTVWRDPSYIGNKGIYDNIDWSA